MSAIQVPFGNTPHKAELPYDSLQFSNRLRALQSLIDDEDGLLFITGVDGNYNLGATIALNYLFFGSSGMQVWHARRDSSFDDCFFAIGKTRTYLYTGTVASFWKLYDLCAPVRIQQLEVVTLSAGEENDVDLAEERKVMCFLDVTDRFRAVSMDLCKPVQGSLSQGLEADHPQVVESWPLIQVFGIQELGSEFRWFQSSRNSDRCRRSWILHDEPPSERRL
eukprot:768796-Hanusia_phi.AAC.5